MVPTEWQVRSVLGDNISKARLISIQAPQYRQSTLISDFLDHANLRIREEVALATNWIKDRPEKLKLQNLAVATMTGPAVRSFPENMNANIQHAMNKCEFLGSGKQLLLHGNPPAIARDFSCSCGSPSTSSCRTCTSSVVCCFKAPSVETFTSLR